MTRIMSSYFCVLAALGMSVSSAREAAAAPLTLNLVQSESFIRFTGDFSTLPLLPQEGVAGTTDLNLLRPSNETTFQGTITIDVDNPMAPTSIQIVSSAADADVSGQWLPEIEPYLDTDGDMNFGEFGEDSLPTQGDNPAPATDADWGVRVFHPAFGANIAWGGLRDVSYNVTSGVEAVGGLGTFSSATENFEFATGWFDYWVAAAAGNLRGRSELAGGDDDNASLLPSTITVTPLLGGQKLIRLMIPIDINSPGDDLNSFYDGQFVAELIVPEPATLFLLSIAGMGIAAAGTRRRR
jgi:hypothetical protein